MKKESKNLLFLTCFLISFSFCKKQILNPTSFERDGKYGFQTQKGELVVDAKYVRVEEFDDYGLAGVFDGKDWYFINREGLQIARAYPFENGPDPFHEGYARILSEDGKVGFLGTNQKILIEPAYDFATPFENGIAKVCNGCKKIVEGEHSSMVGGNWMLINTSGEIVKEGN